MVPRVQPPDPAHTDAAPTAPQHTGPLADVSFAKTSPRAQDAIGDDGASGFIVFAGVGTTVVLILWFAARMIIDLTGASPDLVGVIFIAIGMLTLPPLLVSAIGLNIPRSYAPLPVKADPDKRIHVLCPRERLERDGPLDDTDFEPEYFRIMLVMPRTRLDQAIYVVLVLGAFPLHWVLRSAMSFNIPLFFAFYFTAFLAACVVGAIRQTYVRVAPGRADLMQFTAWRPQADVCRTFDLRSGPVTIDARKRGLIVQPRPHEHWAPASDAQRRRHQRLVDRMMARTSSRGPRFHAFSYIACPTPRRLSHALVRATISTAPIADLPTDRLHD